MLLGIWSRYASNRYARLRLSDELGDYLRLSQGEAISLQINSDILGEAFSKISLNEKI